MICGLGWVPLFWVGDLGQAPDAFWGGLRDPMDLSMVVVVVVIVVVGKEAKGARFPAPRESQISVCM